MNTSKKAGAKAPTESATMLRAAVPAMVAFMRECHLRESQPGRFAMHGSVDDARARLKEFQDRVIGAGFVTTNAHDLGLLIYMERLAGRLLKHSDPELRAALRFNHVHRDDALRLRDVVVFYSVEHAMEGMSVVRSNVTARKLVALAMAKIPKLLGPQLSDDTIKKIYQRVPVEDDPMGPGAR